MPGDSSEIWIHAKSILLPYEGMASQLYVLDVPLRFLPDILDLFEREVRELVVAIDGHAEEPRPLSPEARKEILVHKTNNCQHQLRGIRAGREELQIYLSVDSTNETVDTEIVFWSDQLFPQPDDDAASVATFAHYIRLAESIRARSPASRCVLTASETGNPRDQIGEPWAYSW